MKVQDGSISGNLRSYAAGRFFRFAGAGAKMRNFTSRRFDESMFIYAVGWLRQIFFQLRLRVIGTFLLTFGIYTSASAVLVSIFHETWIAGGNLYIGLSFSLLSIPLLVSRGNISTALLYSRFGSTLCDFLGIRRESLHDDAFSGRTNTAFVLGVLAGTMTFWFPPLTIAACLVAAVGIGIIFALPENGIMALAVLFLFAGQKSQLWVIGITVISYFLKLIRGKRSLSFYRRDIFALLVLLTVVGGGLMNQSGRVFPQTGAYVLFICVYFLATLILYDFRKINRIIAALYVGGGGLAAMYLAGEALNRYLVGSVVRDAGFLLRFVLDLPVFREELASILFMVLIPLAVSGCLRSTFCISRHTSIFCVITMTAALVLCSSGAEVLCACIAVMLLFILYRKRIGYFIFGIALAVFVSLIHLAGSLGNHVYAYFAGQGVALIRGMQEIFSSAMKLNISCFLAGNGLDYTLAESLPVREPLIGFYTDYMQAFGIIGLLVFAVFVIVLIGTSLQLLKKTFKEERVMDELLRFGVVRSPGDMRLGGGAPLCAVAAVLFCGIASPIWQSGTSFGLFWLMCGICTAYVKSASREIYKADQAGSFDCGPENASVSLKRRKED